MYLPVIDREQKDDITDTVIKLHFITAVSLWNGVGCGSKNLVILVLLY